MGDLKYLRLPEVLARIPVSRATLYRWISQGRFPEPIKLGPRCSAWLRAELESWEAGRAAARGD